MTFKQTQIKKSFLATHVHWWLFLPTKWQLCAKINEINECYIDTINVIHINIGLSVFCHLWCEIEALELDYAYVKYTSVHNILVAVCMLWVLYRYYTCYTYRYRVECIVPPLVWYRGIRMRLRVRKIYIYA